MKRHVLHVASEPFEAIALGEKVIESRLFDKKRQKIGLGDTIDFINSNDPEQILSATVVGLHRYGTFKDMFLRNHPAKFGGKSAEWLLNQINRFYSEKQQRQHGVVGIEFEVWIFE